MLGKELRIKDSPSKIHQITDRLICVGGGFDCLKDYVIEQLKENCSSPFIEFDIKDKVRAIDEKVQIKFSKEIKKDKRAQIMVVGFSEIGSTYIVNYIPNEKDVENRINFELVPYGQFYLSAAVPEGFEHVPQIIAASSHQIRRDMTSAEMAQCLLMAIANVQNEMFATAPQKVSEWLCYSLILWDKERLTPMMLSNKICVQPDMLSEVKDGE